MTEKRYDLNNIVEMKKPHPCGTNNFQIVRMGADIKIRCTNCDRTIMMLRRDFDKRLKKVILN